MRQVLVLCYHRVYPGNHITPDVFDQQMRFVAENLVCLNLDQVIAIIRGQSDLADSDQVGVAITFDDGWLDAYVYAFPILQKYRLSATVFVPTFFMSDLEIVRPTLADYWQSKVQYNDLCVGTGLTRPFLEKILAGHSDEFLSWAELDLMVKTGVISVQSHGSNHQYHVDLVEKLVAASTIMQTSHVLATDREKRLRAMIKEFLSHGGAAGRYETEEEWAARSEIELRLSRDVIRSKLGRETSYLAWPFGEYSASSITIAQRVGFAACFTMEPGRVTPQSDVMRINRIGVPRSYSVFRHLFTPAPFYFYACIVKLSERYPMLLRPLFRLSRRGGVLCQSRRC